MTPTEIDAAREIVAAWMETKPTRKPPFIFSGTGDTFPDWWDWDDDQWKPHPKLQTLDAIHVIEARLTSDEWPKYMAAVSPSSDLMRFSVIRKLLHASAEEKLIALSQVLGPEVKKS